MQFTQLGRTDLNVSRLCLGTMTFGWSADQPTSFAIMDAAIDAGINFFDTADIYSSWIGDNQGGESETIIGNWLKNKPRDQVMIATKVRGKMPYGEGLNRAHLTRAVDESLRRLNTDYIDLYQTHWPDDNVPLEETLGTLTELVNSGKVRYIGASNHSADKLAETLRVSAANNFARYDCLQPHYSLLHRREFEQALADLCRRENIAVIPYSPLAAGFLTGKYTRQDKTTDTSRADSGLIQQLTSSDKAFDALDVVRDIAGVHHVPVAQIALAWMLAKDGITAPIIGARTVDQLQEVIGATEVKLTADEIARLDAVSEGF
jgi:aryl-alcohol dehydrogenase-like predicted oxidoreductase